jgi:2,4'-dihydroxyacetophenone dioxygenase
MRPQIYNRTTPREKGGLDFVDNAGNTVATENWQTFLQRYHDHCAENGLTPVDITKF